MAALVELLARVFLPASCTLCGGCLPIRGSRAGVCGSCWENLVPAALPECPRCGGESSGEGECFSCRQDLPPWQAAASLGTYQGPLREVILLWKNRRRDELSYPLAELLLRRLEQLPWPSPDCVVPVPAWWARRLRRGFDHVDLLARQLAALGSFSHLAALRRCRGGSQGGRTRAQRLALPRATFAARRPVEGQVLLVDDVLTTGATARTCTRALLNAGASAVWLLTLARTPKPGRIV